MARWIRLNVDWEDSAWLDAISGQAAGCWPRLLCLAKRDGKGGRFKQPDSSVLARRWRVPRQAVDELIAAAIKDGALEADSGFLTVVNWAQFQEPDPNATERKRNQRARQAAGGWSR